jgi:hypothetical protein
MRLLIALGASLLLATSAAAQATPPPIQGVTGTVATDGTIQSEHQAAHKIAEGVKKVLPGGKGANQNPLDDFAEGRRVVLRDAVDGDAEPAKTTEGVVIDVNRRKQQITVRIAARKTETLRIVEPGGAADVVVSYTDNAGNKVATDFKRVS